MTIRALCLSQLTLSFQLILSLLVVPIPMARGERLPLSPDAPSTAAKSRPATYAVDFRVAVTPPSGTRKLRVWLPLPMSDDAQSVSQRELTTFPRHVEPSISSEPQFGNTFAYFEFDNPSGAQQITHRFKATIHQQDWNIDYASVRRPEVWPSSFRPFQIPDRRSQGRDELRDVLGEIERSLTQVSLPNASRIGSLPLDRLVGAINWVDRNLTYDHVNASLAADPIHAITERRGHCSDYHGLCSTLARAIGFPSRVVYGLQMFDKASPSHCKMEIYLPPFGWVRFDLSETQKLALSKPQLANKIRERTMAGYSENTWLMVTRGVNYELAPRASQPVPVIRTIYAEADGRPLMEPDPSNPDQSTFAWMTMHRVDEIGEASSRFGVLD